MFFHTHPPLPLTGSKRIASFSLDSFDAASLDSCLFELSCFGAQPALTARSSRQVRVQFRAGKTFGFSPMSQSSSHPCTQHGFVCTSSSIILASRSLLPPPKHHLQGLKLEAHRPRIRSIEGMKQQCLVMCTHLDGASCDSHLWTCLHLLPLASRGIEARLPDAVCRDIAWRKT